jgi:hypothetical protein
MGGILLFALFYLGTLQFALFYFDIIFLPLFTLSIYYLPRNMLAPHLKTKMAPCTCACWVEVELVPERDSQSNRRRPLAAPPPDYATATPRVQAMEEEGGEVKARFLPCTGQAAPLRMPQCLRLGPLRLSLPTVSSRISSLAAVRPSQARRPVSPLVPLTSLLVGQPPPFMPCSAAAAVAALIGRRRPWLVCRAPKLHQSSPSLCLSQRFARGATGRPRCGSGAGGKLSRVLH